MSPERLAILENDNQYFKSQVVNIFQILKEHMIKEEAHNDKKDIQDEKRHESLLLVMEKMEERWEKSMDDMDKRKADKLTQTIVFSLIGLILVAVVGGLTSLIIK